jgi:hypothetical protein
MFLKLGIGEDFQMEEDYGLQTVSIDSSKKIFVLIMRRKYLIIIRTMCNRY